MNTIKSVCETFFLIEKTLNLFEQRINDIYFWKLIRFPLFNKITHLLKLYGLAHTKARPNIFSTLFVLPRYLYHSYFHGVFARKSPVDILIFEHGRKIPFDSTYIDIYTEPLRLQMEKNSEFFEIVDRHFLNRHYNKTDKNRSYAEHQTVSHLLKRAFFRINLKTSESEIINIISKLFYQYLGINLPLEKMIRDTVSAFIVERDFYSRLLRKRKVKKVYLVCSYGIEALISACTLNHVECLELQHGTMSRYHLGYSFPNSSSIPYFPDILFLFGDYWRDNTPIPLSKTRLISIGYHYLETQLKQYIVCKKKKNQIIIISQGTIGKDLTRIISVFAKNNPKYAIVYKLHPGECPRWKTEYQELAEAARLSNFSIVDNSEVSLYQLLGESEYAVGVYSTAIYEALVLNCKIILVDLPGVEYMDYLITNNYAKLAQTSDQIKKCLLEGNFKTAEREYFFKPFGFSSEIN